MTTAVAKTKKPRKSKSDVFLRRPGGVAVRDRTSEETASLHSELYNKTVSRMDRIAIRLRSGHINEAYMQHDRKDLLE